MKRYRKKEEERLGGLEKKKERRWMLRRADRKDVEEGSVRCKIDVLKRNKLAAAEENVGDWKGRDLW